MLYAIKHTDFSGASWWLLPACFDSASVIGQRVFALPVCFNAGRGRCWIRDDVPDRALKWSVAGDAAAVCESLGGDDLVVPLPGTGREYEPAPVPDHRPDVPTTGAARPFSPLGGNGKAAAPAGTVAATDGEAD